MRRITGRQLEYWVEGLMIVVLLSVMVSLVFEFPAEPSVGTTEPAAQVTGKVVQKMHQVPPLVHTFDLDGSMLRPLVTVYPDRWELLVRGEWGEGSCKVTKSLWHRTKVGDAVSCDLEGR